MTTPPVRIAVVAPLPVTAGLRTGRVVVPATRSTPSGGCDAANVATVTHHLQEVPMLDPFFHCPDDAEVRIRYFTGTSNHLVMIATVFEARLHLPRLIRIPGVRELRTVAGWQDERGLCQMRAIVRDGKTTQRFSCTPVPELTKTAA
jgi:hypothetical protein